jgi:hypothetical protein
MGKRFFSEKDSDEFGGSFASRRGGFCKHQGFVLSVYY